MASRHSDHHELFPYRWPVDSEEDATKPMRELVKAFACVDQLALRKLAKLLIDSPFFQFLPMARRVPEYRQATIVSSTSLRYGYRHIS
jgi:hypothetical protein